MIIPLIGKTGTGKSTSSRELAKLITKVKRLSIKVVQAEPTCINENDLEDEIIVNPHRSSSLNKLRKTLIYPLLVREEHLLSDKLVEGWTNFSLEDLLIVDGLQAVNTRENRLSKGGFNLSSVDLIINLSFKYDFVIVTINWDDVDYVLGRAQGVIEVIGREHYNVISPFDRTSSVRCNTMKEVLSSWYLKESNIKENFSYSKYMV